MFKYDGKINGAARTLLQLTKINLVWLLFSLPIITVGAATAAQYGAVGMLLDGTGSKPAPVFAVMKEGFKRHFRQATIIWLVSAGLSVAFYFDYSLLMSDSVPFGNALLVVSIITFVTILFILIWIYAVMTGFRGKLRDVIYSAFIFSMMYAPISLIAVAVYAGSVFLFLNFLMARVLLLLFGHSLVIYINLFFFKQAFRRYSSRNDEET